MAEDLGEKTEMPSGRRRSEARERGQVARSSFFGAGVDLLGGFILLVSLGTGLVAGMGGMVRHLLDDASSGPGTSLEHVRAGVDWTFSHAALLAAPFMVVLVALAFVVELVQVGWNPTSQPLVPKLERLNPISGVGRLLGRRNAVRTGISSIKLLVLFVITVLIVMGEWDHIATLPMLEVRPMLAETLRIVWRVLLWLLCVLVLIGIVDLSYQRWQLTQDLRMTKQEVKDEQRSMEGDQEVKGRRLRMARQIALQRLRQSVPKADVIVTNPTHFAVALQYDPKTMDAPRVVAKGADFLAFRIREIASAHNIPIVERPPLARALYSGVPVGKNIRPEFYEAVAEILAYVYRISGRAA